jgi:cytochrome b6-f complex iron-sulfur subunit
MATNPRNRKKITRREFVGIVWGISVVGLFGQAGLALSKFFKPRMPPDGFGSEVVAGNLEEFEPGSVNYVQKGRFYIVRREDGGVLALWQRCPHLGCTVPWREDQNQFNCPCHSSFFNRQGEVIGGPAPRPMDLFPVSLQDSQLVVDTSQPIQRQQFDDSQVFFPS